MSGAKHTPGPWAIENNDFVVDKNGDILAEVVELQRGAEEHAANVAAMAVAPELLEALEVARAELRVAASYADYPDEVPGMTAGLRCHAEACKRALTVVDAAIAKAKVES